MLENRIRDSARISVAISVISLIFYLAFPQDLSMAPNFFNDVLHSTDQDNVVMNNNDEMLNAIQILKE